MTRFFEALSKHLLTAIKSLGRHLAMTLSSASAVMVTLILMALFLLLAGNVSSFASNVEADLMIHASIDKIKNETEINGMQTKIEAFAGVKHVTFSSKEEELNILIDESGAVFERYKDNNPMPNVFIVEVKDANQIPLVTKKLNKMDGIENAQYGGESIENMIKTFDGLRVGGAIFLLGLGFIAVFLISNTIRMTIYTRNREIAIMRSVGATNWYIKTPFMIEGMFIGIIGALVPVLLTSIGYSVMYDYLGGNFLSSMFVMQKPFPFVTEISVLLLIGGAVVGILGSFLAVNKYLRWSR